MRETIWGVLYGELVVRHLSTARADVDAGGRSYVELMTEMWWRARDAPAIVTR